MIYIGVTGWGDHDSIYPDKMAAKDKLKEYGGHFPAVEVDASFYAVQPKRNVERWIASVPAGFQFIVKAYQGMTGHQRGKIPFDSREEMFAAFRDSVQPFQEAGKLAMILFQFPPWFDCSKENVETLRYCRKEMGGLPLALEFRNQSWYSPPFKEKTLQFMESEGWIHTVCDEPQAGEGSVPLILKATDKKKTLMRLHGRNVHGWTKPAAGDKWREVRYLYRYNHKELTELAEQIRALHEETEDVFVLFNNNSGGDAADNAKQIIEILGIEYKGLSSRQLDLL
ncbi:DUF72 domain-containing protein [Peribacillus sp. SCS-37]|uniref:DUF72 domain-containing protein n=1 Tax=Paraperibacillus esterisolvens TaxID=3115296 RepID=UPI003905A599